MSSLYVWLFIIFNIIGLLSYVCGKVINNFQGIIGCDVCDLVLRSREEDWFDQEDREGVQVTIHSIILKGII